MKDKMVFKDSDILLFSYFIIDGHANFFNYHHYNQMFVDAVKYNKSHTHPTYIWESTGRTVPTIFLRHRNNTATYNDMCAVTSGVHSTHIQSESCSANRYALCQLR